MLSLPLYGALAQLDRATVFVFVGELATRYGLAIEIISSNLIEGSVNRRSLVRVQYALPVK